eukprot:TRINITY_DN1824_c0_g1_i3.p3 TRINITY_DN1824_c0_g1~~TRINITY_DN1824_c0_g1_i3.p3  ORF type:complete len:137 (+),score=56.57 TRINITY_DN1824_c0_g1_i3:608-1018(+)
MVDEHFGIGVVEALAAGAVVVAHDSGGVATDIIGASVDAPAATGGGSRSAAPPADIQRGVLVSGRGEGEVAAWAAGVRAVLHLDTDAYVGVQTRGRQWVGRFGEEAFTAGFLGAIGGVVDDALATVGVGVPGGSGK